MIRCVKCNHVRTWHLNGVGSCTTRGEQRHQPCECTRWKSPKRHTMLKKHLEREGGRLPFCGYKVSAYGFYVTPVMEEVDCLACKRRAGL